MTRRVFLLALLSSICVSCSGATVRYDAPHVLIRGVPFYPQEDYQCGPASLASVMNYWGAGVTPAEIAKEIFSGSARGTLNLDMLLYPKGRGLDALQYRGSWDDLKKRVGQGYPLILMVDYGFSVVQANHFLVVVGYGDDGVVVNSGKSERVTVGKEEFLSTWKKTNYWTLLIKK